MAVSTGRGRILNGSGADRVKRNNLTELRGTFWEAVTDWFFGYTSVNHDWTSTADADLFYKWTYTADGTQASELTTHPETNTAEVEAVAGTAVDISNLRELFVIPQTGTWGIAHAQTEVISGPYWSAGGNVKPQHGLALRAQEDTRRRAVIAWHDVAFGNPHAINLGVWSGALDGTGFTNRQISMTMALGQSYTVTAATRTSNIVTATIAGHNLRLGDRINVDFGTLWDPTFSQRASNVVTHTITGHPFVTGDKVQVAFGGTFDGTFTLTGATATTITYNQTGSDETNASGAGLIIDKTDDRDSQIITAKTADTVSYSDAGPDKTIGAGTAARQFPYYMEARVAGNIAEVRCWDRDATRPEWDSPTNSLLVDLDSYLRNFTVTAAVRTSNVVTLTIGTHPLAVGERINVDLANASYDGSNFRISAITATTVSYPHTGSDLGTSTGTMTRIGCGANVADVNGNPTPKGTGRIGFVSSHLGTRDDCRVVYGELFGDNDPDTLVGFDQRLDGSSAVSSGASAGLSIIRGLAGPAGSSSSATGQLGISFALGSHSDTSAAAGASLAVSRPLTGHADGASSAAGSTAVARPLGSHADVAVAAAASLIAQRPLAGQVSAAVDARAALVAARPLACRADVATAASGTLVVVRPLSGRVDQAGYALGAITVPGTLAGPASAAASLTGTLVVARPLASAVGAATAAMGTVTALLPLAAPSAAAVSAAGLLTLARSLAGHASVSVAATGAVVIFVPLDVAGAGDLAASWSAGSARQPWSTDGLSSRFRAGSLRRAP